MDFNKDYIQIAGTVTAVLFSNEDNGYTVIKVDTQDGGSITAVGCLPGTAVGEQIILTGEFVRSPTHGEQFKAEWAERRLPVGEDAIYDFLASRSIKGVGPATATLLVSAFGDKTLQVIENEPERLCQIKGISRKKAKEISDIFKKQIIVRRLLEYLANYGVRPVIAVRLYRLYGDEAMERLEENPYIISRDNIGASFTEADTLALGSGFDGDAPERVAAAALYELQYNTRNGHCFIPYADLIDVTAALIEVSAEQIEEAVDMLMDSGDIVRSQVAGRDACYLSAFYEAETGVAKRIKELSSAKCAAPRNLEKLISQIEAEQSVAYADLQSYSLKVAATHRIMILTGGPGTGKTTAVRGIVALFDKLKMETILTAPTGRAAKRMTELTGSEAFTVHRLLEAGYTEDGDELIFRRNERDPLKCDAVILDECSMVDITLMNALLSAMPPNCRLVLVGDADQLPSVGPGNVFNDIIRSGIVETVRLTDIFRQTKQSRIVANAHVINRGDYPDLKDNRSDSDFFFLKRTSAYQAVETVKQLCAERLPNKMGIPAADIQVLSPTRKGEAGTRNLNAVLQNALNPADDRKKEKKFGEIVFREGDRVMQIRNNYDIITVTTVNGNYKNLINASSTAQGACDTSTVTTVNGNYKNLINASSTAQGACDTSTVTGNYSDLQAVAQNAGSTDSFSSDAQLPESDDFPMAETSEKPTYSSGIFNGDIGEIISIDPETELCYVLFDDKVAAYGFDELGELEHAFAVTVHKSQGSEYRAVILMATEGAPQLMNRKVLYTAVTRAKELLIVVGNDGTVFRMIDNHKVSRRYSGLRARLVEQ